MPIKRAFTMVQVSEYMQKHRDRYEEALLDILKQTGEDTVRYMRSVNTYKDQTANLRNSEGFMIYRDGQPLLETYPNDTTGNKPGEKIGAAIGQSLAEEVAELYAPEKGFLLVVTVGMHYAIYVEAKGYDVITGGSKNGAKFIKTRMKKLHDKISKAK